MRELTKSMLRFSWALPLFGIRQMSYLALPTDVNVAKATQAFEALTDAARRELGQALADLYKTGDQLQTELVDAMTGAGGAPADLFNPAAWMPTKGSGGCCGGQGKPTVKPTIKPTGQGASSSAGPAPVTPMASTPAGWGPVVAS